VRYKDLVIAGCVLRCSSSFHADASAALIKYLSQLTISEPRPRDASLAGAEGPEGLDEALGDPEFEE